MHDGMKYERILGQGHEPFRIWKSGRFERSNAISSAIYNGGWQLTTDS